MSVFLLGPTVDFEIQIQRPDIRLIFHYHLLPYDIRLTLDLLSFDFLRGRCFFAHALISHQGRYIDTHQ